MLYALLEWMHTELDIPGLGVVKYLSFRAAMAIIFSLLICLVIGKPVIELLRRWKMGERIRELGPETHKKKAGTPTMGGLLIIFAIVIPTLLWADLSNMYVILILVATIWMGLIGFIDDYIKVFKKNKAGLKGKFKVAGQVSLGIIVGLTMVLHPDFSGPVGRIGNGGKLIVNDYLKSQGFESGDVLLQIDGIPYTYKQDSMEGATYLVERKEGAAHEKYPLTIAPEERAQVQNAIFGLRDKGFVTKTNVPFVKDYAFDYSKIAFWEKEGNGWGSKIIYILIVIFILTAVSNGVNITDGLDGLAAGTSAISAVTLAIFAYVSGNLIFSDYLNIFYIPQSAELTIFCAALIGGCVGFLWFNAHPAQVFMGDTGSLMLGSAIGTMALMVKKELLLVLICGVFLIESLSVILQVSYFKYTKRRFGEGRRIFRMAPLHHHYEKKGIHEAKIVSRFWIVAVILCLLAFVTLKLR